MITPTPPADHLPGALKATDYDVIVIGAGSTGENVVSAPVAAGMRVAVVEAELVGGECSYWACMPSKALLRPLQVLDEAGRIGGAVSGATLDPTRVLARRDKFNSGLDDAGQVSWLDGAGATLVRGRARMVGEKAVEVTGADGSTARLVATAAVVLCTGSEPSIPPVEGLADLDPWTNREATSATSVPASLVVVGGGPVGCELAQAWRGLGATVSLVQTAPRLLAALEPEAAERVLASLRADGVEVHLGVALASARTDGDSKALTLEDGTELRAAEVLVAAGRRPSTTGLGLEVLGLEDGAPLEVDDTTTVTAVPGKWLYAAGDCTTAPRLTHMGKYQARICGAVIAARAGGDAGDTADPAPWTPLAATAVHTAVPAVVFTNPEVASVGLTEAKARDASLPIRTVEYEIGNVAGAAVLADGYDGWAKLVVDTDRNVIVGATFVGPGVAELLHAATVAIVGEVTLDRLWHAVPSYPTVSEIWLRLMETAASHS